MPPDIPIETNNIKPEIWNIYQPLPHAGRSADLWVRYVYRD